LPDYTSQQWDTQLGVNLKSAFLFAKYAIPELRKRGGSIVNIASVHAFVSYPGNVGYDASKAGMLALTRTLALDHGRDGIRVNAICPGYVDTPMTQRSRSGRNDAGSSELSSPGAHRHSARHRLGRALSGFRRGVVHLGRDPGDRRRDDRGWTLTKMRLNGDARENRQN
jgi:NAD(P)-dependent dehydrogenase (short-subunit alcohol dehydrogenase family)